MGALALRCYAGKHDTYEPYRLKPETLRLLQPHQDRLKKLISRNVSLEEQVEHEASL